MIIPSVNFHENRRMSTESYESDGSVRTGFSYEDSIGGRITFTFPRSVTFTHRQQSINGGSVANNVMIINNDALRKYEIQRCLLQDMVVIGEGAFGVVARANLLKERDSTEKQIVAVKMLKGS